MNYRLWATYTVYCKIPINLIVLRAIVFLSFCIRHCPLNFFDKIVGTLIMEQCFVFDPFFMCYVFSSTVVPDGAKQTRLLYMLTGANKATEKPPFLCAMNFDYVLHHYIVLLLSRANGFLREDDENQMQGTATS